MKIIVKVIVLVICVLSIGLTFSVRADSGWDGGYDGGGYSGGGYSGGWDSYYDTDWGSDSSSGSWNLSGLPEDPPLSTKIIVGLSLITLAILIWSTTLRSSKKDYSKGDSYYDISDVELQKYLPDMTVSKLKEILFKDFVDIQDAWMNFDYDKLRELCSDELYNSYVAQLDALKLKNGKNVMSGYTEIKSAITSIKDEAGVLAVKVYLIASFKDYVIDTKTEEVIRGNKKGFVINHYIMTFVKGKDEIATKCPNCGAELKDSASSVCEYCRATISKTTYNFVLSKKTCVNDRKGDIEDDLK